MTVHETVRQSNNLRVTNGLAIILLFLVLSFLQVNVEDLAEIPYTEEHQVIEYNTVQDSNTFGEVVY